MKKIIPIILFFLSLHFICYSQTPANDPHWVQQWEYDFINAQYVSGAGTTTISKAGTEIGDGPQYWNIEDQYDDGGMVEIYRDSSIK